MAGHPPRCRLAGCLNPAAVDATSGLYFQFCSVAHQDQFTKASVSTVETPAGPRCGYAGCTSPAYVDASGRSLGYCSKAHMDASQTFSKCSLPTCSKSAGGRGFCCAQHSNLSTGRIRIVDSRDLAVFTNDAITPFTRGASTFQSVDHYIQAQRFSHAAKQPLQRAVLQCPQACDAVSLAESCASLQDMDWDTRKYAEAFAGMQAKFSSAPVLQAQLISTGGAELVLDAKNGGSSNVLGRLLMAVRATFQECSCPGMPYDPSVLLAQLHAEHARMY